MKLVNPRLGLEVELSENQVLNITVELPVKFSEVVFADRQEEKKENSSFRILKRNCLWKKGR